MDRDFDMKTVRLASGLSIAYCEVGEPDPVTVWIHGMGSYRESLHPVLKHPPVPGRHVAFDLPGFGDSGHLSRRQDLVDYAAVVDGFLEGLHLTDVVLAGHSFGGMVAGETLVRHPGRIRGVVLISAAGWIDPINALSPTPIIWVNRIGIWMTGMEWFGRRMLKALGADPELVSREDRRRLQRGWRKAYEMARMGPFYHSPDFADRVLGQDRPVAVIHGSRDILFPLERVEAVINQRAPLFVIEGSGHVPFLSHPQQFDLDFRHAYHHAADIPHSDSQ